MIMESVAAMRNHAVALTRALGCVHSQDLSMRSNNVKSKGGDADELKGWHNYSSLPSLLTRFALGLFLIAIKFAAAL